MKKLLTLLLLTSFSGLAQIKGCITDEKGNPIPSVVVHVENSYKNTTSNEKGNYVLNWDKKETTLTLIFKHLGYKT